jgi:hypothetical protein
VSSKFSYLSAKGLISQFSYPHSKLLPNQPLYTSSTRDLSVFTGLNHSSLAFRLSVSRLSTSRVLNHAKAPRLDCANSVHTTPFFKLVYVTYFAPVLVSPHCKQPPVPHWHTPSHFAQRSCKSYPSCLRVRPL